MEANTKKSTRRFGVGRKRKLNQLRQARLKKSNHTSATVVDLASSVTVPASSNNQSSQSSTELKFKRYEHFSGACSSSNVDSNTSKYCVIDISLLSSLVDGINCDVCGNKGLVILEGQKDWGLASELELKCPDCLTVISKCSTSRRLSDEPNSPFDITTRMVTAMIDIGIGYAGLEKFTGIMGMNNINHSVFNKYTKTVSKAATDVTDDSLAMAAKIVREAYSELEDQNPGNIIDITVSYDGSWMRRGHTSNFGVGVVIDILTGLVLDYEVMSKYCHKCSHLKDDFKKSPDYIKWKESHICDKNFSGISGAMEIEAAMAIWKRSVEKYNFRYTTLLSDGDAKTFLSLSNAEIYGKNHPLQKEECINHVAKRMGTALRKVVTECRTKGITLGGKGDGKLTSEKITRLTLYYQRAIRNNNESTEKMRNAIYATLFHAVSSDEDPHHNYCPMGVDSWCFYNRALAKQEEPGKHAVMVGTPLNREVGEHLLPVYKRLSEEELLKRCMRGRTQNANESLHSLIWKKCPKTSFLQKTRVETGVALAVSHFNRGCGSIVETLQKMGVSPGVATVSALKTKDVARLNTSIKRAEEKEKHARQVRKLAKLRAEEKAVASEGGPSYAAGQF